MWLVQGRCVSSNSRGRSSKIVGAMLSSKRGIGMRPKVVAAKVTAMNKSTNASRTTETDSSGQYSIPSLPTGTYSLSVEAAGFQGQRTDSLVLEASQTARQDFKVVAGLVSETVTVESGA